MVLSGNRVMGSHLSWVKYYLFSFSSVENEVVTGTPDFEGSNSCHGTQRGSHYLAAGLI